MRERILLLEPDDRDVIDLVLAPIREKLVVEFARANQNALHLFRIDLVGIADHRVEASVRQRFERRHCLFVPQQALRAHHDQRLAVVAHHLPPQQMVDLRGRRWHAHLHVVLRAQLQIALRTGGRMFGALAFVAMRQQQHEPADAAPFHFAGADELVDHHLRAVGEVPELRFPDDQLIRLRCRITILEAHRCILGQHAVDDFEVGLAFLQVLQGDPCAGVPFLAVLVVQHRMAMRKCPAGDVLARNAHAITLIEQRRVSERLAHSPVERLLAFCHRASIGHDAFDTRMQLEIVRNVGRPDGETLELRKRDTRVGRIGPMLVGEPRPVDGKGRLVVRQNRRVRVIALVHRRAIGRDHVVRIFGADHACGDQLVGVELARARVQRDLLVHQRLRDHRLVGFVVPEPPETDEIDEHILVELLPVVERQFDCQQAHFGIVAVHVEDRRFDHLGDVGAIRRAARVARIGRREADLIVDDDMDGAAGVVPARLRHVQAFLNDALSRDRGIAVHQDR